MPFCRTLTVSYRGCSVAARVFVLFLLAGPLPVGLADELRAELNLAAMVSADRDQHTSEAVPSSERIDELIRQLGHSRYSVRRSAANELRQVGPEAFDSLHAATDDADPEIAASARYLLLDIPVRWVHSDDPPAVRRILSDFGDQSDELRLGRVEQLARLSAGEGLAGLCRIARFDRSPLVSRAAALAIIRPASSAVQKTPIDSEVIGDALGPSTRVAVKWLQQYLRQVRDPAAAVAPWQPLIDDEVSRLEQRADDTSPEIVLGLLWNVAELHRQLDNGQAVIEVLNRMVALDEDLAEQTSVDLLLWLAKHKSWEVLDEFLIKHQARLEQGKRPLYYAALARAEQGQNELADQLAERAFTLDASAPLEGFWTAKELEERGKFDWSEREYRHVLHRQRVTTHEAILARIELSSLLFDHAQYEAAADVLEPLVKVLREDDKVAQLYAQIQRFDRERYGLNLPNAESVACRYHFYRAGQHRVAQDWSREREELERAIKLDRTDADVLIAMYHVPEADEKWRATTMAQVRSLCQEFQQDIDDAPNDPTPYNQWAWLVSNTEGDFQQAIRYSHRSIELIPAGAGESAAASFLDTLGRCYYAAGDLESAVKYQRQAIEKISHMQVMQRQLALFEKALAEKGQQQEAGGGVQAAGGEQEPKDDDSSSN